MLELRDPVLHCEVLAWMCICVTVVDSRLEIDVLWFESRSGAALAVKERNFKLILWNKPLTCTIS